jgi:hypothetical protein
VIPVSENVENTCCRSLSHATEIAFASATKPKLG